MTVIVTGVAARHPSTSAPAHRWRPIAFVISGTDRPRRPSTATIRSPPLRYDDAGAISVPAAMVCDATGWPLWVTISPWWAKIAAMITNAITRLTAGPARIVTTRFQTFWL